MAGYTVTDEQVAELQAVADALTAAAAQRSNGLDAVLRRPQLFATVSAARLQAVVDGAAPVE